VSFEAGAWIRERGGALYLWEEEFGDFALDRIDTSDPGGVDFIQIYAGEGVWVFIDSRVTPAEGVRVELRHPPFRGVRVYWDGVPWGRRGDGGGGGGG
jgi:hypothetical protein